MGRVGLDLRFEFHKKKKKDPPKDRDRAVIKYSYGYSYLVLRSCKLLEHFALSSTVYEIGDEK